MRKSIKSFLSLLLVFCLFFAARPYPTNAETVYKNGDTDGSGALAAADTALILRHLSGLVTLTGDALVTADANLDDSVTAADASAVLRFLAGLSYLPGWGVDLDAPVTLGSFLEYCVGMENHFWFCYDYDMLADFYGGGIDGRYLLLYPPGDATGVYFPIEDIFNAENPAEVSASYIGAALTHMEYDELRQTWIYNRCPEYISNPSFDDFFRLQCRVSEEDDYQNKHPHDHDYRMHMYTYEPIPADRVNVYLRFTMTTTSCLETLKEHASFLEIPGVHLWSEGYLSIPRDGEIHWDICGMSGGEETFFTWNPGEIPYYYKDAIALYYTLSSENVNGFDDISFYWEYGDYSADFPRIKELYNSGTATGTEILDVITQLYMG